MTGLPPGFELIDDHDSAASLPPGFEFVEDEEPSAMDYAQGFFGGINRGIPKLAGLPVELANAALSTIGLDSKKPFMGREFIADAMGGAAEELGAPRDEFYSEGPDNQAGRIISRVGEEIGMAALPSAVILRAGSRAAQAGGSAAQSLWNRFFAPIGNSPGRASAGEAVATVGAGTGAGIAQETDPGNAAAEAIGQVAGGLAPSAIANSSVGLAVRSANKARQFLSPEEQSRRGAEAARQALGEEMTADARAGLALSEQLRKDMPGFNPTLAEASGSPALIATQRALEQKASAADLDQIVKRRFDSESAIARYAEGIAPKGEPVPDFVVDTANRRVQALRNAVAAQSAGIGQERSAVAEAIPSVPDRADAGVQIRDALRGERSATQSRMSELASELGIANADVTVEFQKAADTLAKEFTPGSIFADMQNVPSVVNVIRQAGRSSPVETGLLDEAGRPVVRTRAPERITFQDLKTLRERVSDDLLDAMSAANPSRMKVRSLTMLKGRVDGLIDDLTRSADPDLAARYKQFRDAYFTDYIQRFERGAAFKIRQRDGRGFYRTPDERVAETFFAMGRTSHADQFNAVFRGNAKANAALESVALDSLRDYAVREGVIAPQRFEQWKRLHSGVLKKFPDIEAKLAKIENADGVLVSRQAQLTQRAQQIEDQALTRELRAYGRASKASQDVIEAAIREPRKMAQLTSVLKRDPEALNGLRRHIWDRTTDGKAQDILSFVERNEAGLKMLFRQPHLKAIKDIAAARLMLERVPVPSGSAYQARPLEAVEKLIGQGVPQLSSRVFALQSGRVQKGYLYIDTLVRGLRGRAQTSADDAFRAALYDPEVAKAMLEAINTGKLKPETAKRLQARMFAIGATAVDGEKGAR